VKETVVIAVAIAELGKRWDSDPGVGAPPAAGGYNTAAAHLRIDRHLLVNPKAPVLSKAAANPLLFEQRDERVKRHM
jgi:hypothetical protein